MHNSPRAETDTPKKSPREIFNAWFPNNEWALLAVIAVEVFVFGISGENFLTAANGFEIGRLGVELGLLALALTPIIISGGIDLSAGSMMGLSAVVFGALWRDAQLPIPAAIVLTLAAGLAGGALNAVMIARFQLPPLIVTLGSFSLFRGLAEALTRGIENYSGFPPSFLFFGQGYLGGVLPPQLLLLGAAIIGYALLLHRTSIGRAIYAIGFSPEGARFAGIPVARRLALIYMLSGAAASAAAIVYVAHLGQAKADAGTGFELMAITAVVLGGTSIFGGRGTIPGSVLGLIAIVVLQNGLRLSGQPAELAGILTGALLVATILIDRATRRARIRTAAAAGIANGIAGDAEEAEEAGVKNSQVAVLSAVILAAALIVAGSNWLLVRSLRESAAPQGGKRGESSVEKSRPVIAMMPKAKGDPYFISCRQGAEEAARELGVDLLWDGPTDLDPAKQNEVVEAWITRGVDAIAVSVENQAGISTVLRKARERGIGVLTWDADSERDARDFFINQATPQGIGYTLMDEAARILDRRGEFAIITASLSAANQNEWIRHIRARLAAEYPEIKLVAVQPSDGDRDRAFAETQTVLKVHPGVRLVMAIAAPAVPGAAEAVKQSGRSEVKVTGLSLPNMCKPYVHSGVIESFVLWNTVDLGYLTVYAARALVAKELKPGARRLGAGRLGEIAVEGDEVRLGAPFIFNKSNIDRFDF
ncbi:MAG: substrate-binding domain-containing protein [Acidobacteria bacterium]|nr:substrate-binding domain-containing protein [Acidobacteriota bacterium]MCW5971186.1 substrate-binding domain-containing protein [Blastocatellales bacterium]